MNGLTIAAGTKNKAKLTAIEHALNQLALQPFEVTGISVPSNVSDQPFGNEETMTGAINRASLARSRSGAKLGLGLEGGVVETSQGLFICNWGALKDERFSAPFVAGGASLPLPEEVARKVRAGQELGPVMEAFSQRENIRQQEGAVGIFTNGRVGRSMMFSHIVMLLIGQWECKLAEKEMQKNS
ncbi:DUF84 family protein [Jeotgalibacillus proteolyticus]|uniref:inosine/xanthosine triphosphatase n=1 Tax=Jeotgalibacillus proteolyticus TaxID=2082395 RepID=A0A2S5GF73_9BACL|nr:DUF84 family protein [Jeotgalibacillus proteolyticus]PPA71680.1 inosine/xanthosine triphosphatase [Jeotgalibacillus proteolyticus]